MLHKTCPWKFTLRDRRHSQTARSVKMIKPRTPRGYSNFSKLTHSISMQTEVRRTVMSRRHLNTPETTEFTAT
jgi:hypothetical protein